MEEKAVPATRQKAKTVGKDISIFFSAVKSVIKGEQPKTLQMYVNCQGTLVIAI